MVRKLTQKLSSNKSKPTISLQEREHKSEAVDELTPHQNDIQDSLIDERFNASPRTNLDHQASHPQISQVQATTPLQQQPADQGAIPEDSATVLALQMNQIAE